MSSIEVLCAWCGKRPEKGRVVFGGDGPQNVCAPDCKTSVKLGFAFNADSPLPSLLFPQGKAYDEAIERERLRGLLLQGRKDEVGGMMVLRRLKLCICGGNGKHQCEYAYLRCDACQLVSLEAAHERVRKCIATVFHAILPNDHGMRTWEQATEVAIAEVKKLRERHYPGDAYAEHLTKKIEEALEKTPVSYARCRQCGSQFGPPEHELCHGCRREANAKAEAFAKAQREAPTPSASLASLAGLTRRVYNPNPEAGPGLAARYPDATPAAKPTNEPKTCDVGADWED